MRRLYVNMAHAKPQLYDDIFSDSNWANNLDCWPTGKQFIRADEKLTAFLQLKRSLVRMEVWRENLRQN
jgi:hypothetical protein